MFLAFVSLTDGYRVKIAETPACLPSILQLGPKTRPAVWESFAKDLNQHFAAAEADWQKAKELFPPVGTPLVRAGTVIFGAADLLVHGGVGTVGHVCAGTGSDRRLTFLTQVIPGKLWDLFKLRTDLSLVRPLGLFKDMSWPRG